MWNRLRRLRERPPEPAPSFQEATLDDVYTCFRLLLRRLPTGEEQLYWKNLVANHRITLQAMVDEFLAGAEFQEKQAAARAPQAVDLGDYRLYVRPNDFFVGAAIARDRQYEPAVTSALRAHLRPGDVFVDVGANIGYFTLLAATLVGKSGQVHAFEPNPDNCHLLTLSLAANNAGNVTLYPFAAAEKEQTFQLDIAGAGSNGRVIDSSEQAVPGSSPPQPVQAVVLDTVLAEIERLDLLKMDIEGAEPRAFQGMRQLLQRHRPILLTEFAPALIEITSHVTGASYLEQITSLGYELFIVGAKPPEPRRGLSTREILDAQAQSGVAHLDLIAYPAGSALPTSHRSR